MLYSISWTNIIVWLGNMGIATICFPVYDAKIVKLTLPF